MAGDNHEESDARIVDRVRNGETSLYRHILDRYSARLRRYVVHIVHSPDDADDVVQETFIKAFRNLWAYHTARPFSSWIYRIAHNEALNWLRQHKRMVYGDDARTILELSPSQSDPASDFLEQEQTEQIERWLDALPLAFREVIALHYLDDRSYQEISDIMRIPINTVSSRMSRGKAMLRAQIAREKRGSHAEV